MRRKAAVAFMAHPDDAEICMGGTLALLADNDWDVHVVVAAIPDQRARRLDEVMAGAAQLGVTAHVLEREGTWQVEDMPTYLLVRAFDGFMRDLGPERVFTHWNGDAHLDHVLVARAALSAVRDHRADLYMCEQPNQYAPGGSAFLANTYIDVTEYFELRVKAVQCHQSQMAARDYDTHLRTRARYHGEQVHSQYAEAFLCVRQRLCAC